MINKTLRSTAFDIPGTTLSVASLQFSSFFKKKKKARYKEQYFAKVMRICQTPPSDLLQQKNSTWT